MKEKTVNIHITIFSAVISLLVGIAGGGYWVGCQISESQKDRVYLDYKFTQLEKQISESISEIKHAQSAILKQCCSELYANNNNNRYGVKE